MSDQPEIDRRCSSCGVAIRQRALFCPQCGKAVASADSLAETVDLKIPDSAKSFAESADTVALDSSVLESSALAKPAVQPDSPNNNPRNIQPAQTDSSVRNRVDKLRKASTVVIEQASYDPSLRFLLVAGGLFFLFILLLVLSKLLG